MKCVPITQVELNSYLTFVQHHNQQVKPILFRLFEQPVFGLHLKAQLNMSPSISALLEVATSLEDRELPV